VLIPPTKNPCAQCGAEMDYHHDLPEEVDQVCSQCCCLLAGCCDACGEGECRGMAWPEGHPPPLPQ
jgi:hypothetical protein